MGPDIDVQELLTVPEPLQPTNLLRGQKEIKSPHSWNDDIRGRSYHMKAVCGASNLDVMFLASEGGIDHHRLLNRLSEILQAGDEPEVRGNSRATWTSKLRQEEI